MQGHVAFPGKRAEPWASTRAAAAACGSPGWPPPVGEVLSRRPIGRGHRAGGCPPPRSSSIPCPPPGDGQVDRLNVRWWPLTPLAQRTGLARPPVGAGLQPDRRDTFFCNRSTPLHAHTPGAPGHEGPQEVLRATSEVRPGRPVGFLRARTHGHPSCCPHARPTLRGT